MTSSASPGPQPRHPVWDPTLPVLSGLLARMADLQAVYLRAENNQVVFHARAPLRIGNCEDSPTQTITPVREPVSVSALLDEQLRAEEVFLASLSGERSEFEIPLLTRLSPLLPTEAPLGGHWLLLRVSVYWSDPGTVHLHVPMEVSTVC